MFLTEVFQHFNIPNLFQIQDHSYRLGESSPTSEQKYWGKQLTRQCYCCCFRLGALWRFISDTAWSSIGGRLCLLCRGKLKVGPSMHNEHVHEWWSTYFQVIKCLGRCRSLNGIARKCQGWGKCSLTWLLSHFFNQCSGSNTYLVLYKCENIPLVHDRRVNYSLTPC